MCCKVTKLFGFPLAVQIIFVSLHRKIENKHLVNMPQISFFYGIYIWMNFSDHQPPHFHAWYGDYKVIVNIKDGVVKGEMPGRALRMILEWLDVHRAELMNNWDKAQKGEPLDKIEPLK